MPHVQARTTWRFALAQDIAHNYITSIEGIAAIVLVGSVARHLDTAHSDIDLLIYWHDDVWPTTEAIAKTIGAKDRIVEDTTEAGDDPALVSWGEVFYLGGGKDTGLKVDITHKTVASAEQLIEDVVNSHSTLPIKLGIASSLKHAVALYGDELLAHWQRQLGQCPLPIIEHIVTTNVMMYGNWVLPMLAERNDWLMYHVVMNKAVEKVLMLLCAINQMYPPMAFKHLATICQTFDICPTRLLERIETALHAKPQYGIQTMHDLIEETFALIEQHLPYIDITNARTQFYTVRTLQHEPIQLNKHGEPNNE